MRTLVKDTTTQQSIRQEGNPNTLNWANCGKAGGAALPLHVAMGVHELVAEEGVQRGNWSGPNAWSKKHYCCLNFFQKCKCVLCGEGEKGRGEV